MTFRSHGASHSFKVGKNKNSVPRLHFCRPMKPPYGAGGGGVGGVIWSQSRRMFATSSTSLSSLSSPSATVSSDNNNNNNNNNNNPQPRSSKMSSSDSTPQTWHSSHGIVFAGESRTTPFRPPMSRNMATQAPAKPLSLRDKLMSWDRERTSGTVAKDSASASVPSPVVAPKQEAERTAAKIEAKIEAKTEMKDIKAKINEQAKAEVKVQEEPKQETDHDQITAPFTPLDFKIPDDKFREAKNAPKGSPESYWNYSHYRCPSEGEAEPRSVMVHYCAKNHTMERVLKQYFANEKLLGFDLEWMPFAKKTDPARKNICVLQLASESHVALFHLAIFPPDDSLVTPTLKKILEDPEVTKVGVWIMGDAGRVENYLDIKPRGLFELSHLYKLVRYSASGEYNLIDKRLISLAAQAEDVLGLPLFKGTDVRTSDWSQKLSLDQIIYGASDAYAAVQIYAILNHQREQLNPTPPLPYHAELRERIRLAEGVSISSPPVAEEPSDTDAPPAEETTPGSGLSESVIKSVDDTIRDESEEEANGGSDSPPPPAAAAKPKKEVDPRVAEASTWAAQYRVANPKIVPTLAQLRSYHIWYNNEDLDVAKICSLLRDPPLMPTTVATYICNAVKHERFPFDKRRLRDEVLKHVPGEGPETRYRGLRKACEDIDDDE